MKESRDPKVWWARAMQDLMLAQTGCRADANAMSAAICYCCQQACEKMLKSHLLSTGWRLEKTHDLRTLANEAKKSIPALSSVFEELLDLNADFLQSRYPFTFDPGFGEADAQRAVETAKSLKSLLENAVLSGGTGESQ